MPKSEDRFYLMEMSHRPVLWGDIGSFLRIEGLVVGSNKDHAVMMFPDSKLERFTIFSPNVEAWSEFIRRSDDPEILVGIAKVFQRKARYAISGAVQQKVWAADGFKCAYCNAKMGKVLLTVDHFIPLEQGGANDTSNYISACKMCNKKKGSQSAIEFCRDTVVDYDAYVDYLKHRKIE